MENNNMLKKIYRLDGDLGVSEKIINQLRCRELSQEFIYFGNGANNFYNYVYNKFLKGGNISNKNLSINPWKNLLTKENNDLSKKYVYIGVACGDSKREIEFIKSLKNSNIIYIGVDLSSEMIELSKQNLEKENFDYVLIQADIFNPYLINQINTIIGRDAIKSFLFLGGTFGNFKTTNITDLLGSYLKKGEKLYMEVGVKGTNIKDDFELHNYYVNKSLNSKDWIEYILSGFKYINFPIDKGEVVIETLKNEQIGLFGIHHYFKLNENIEFVINNKSIIFGEGEKIKFFSVIFYEAEKLINFMKLHHFKLFDKDLDNGVLGQFIFEKE